VNQTETHNSQLHQTPLQPVNKGAKDIDWDSIMLSGRWKRTFDHMSKLVMEMDYAHKKHGKTSLFGQDKGEKHFTKFCDLLVPQLRIMVLDDFINRDDEPEDICHVLHMVTVLFVTAFPRWQDAVHFSFSFFIENKQISIKIVSAQIGKI